MRILFQDRDIARVRLSASLDPVVELQGAAHRRFNIADPVFGRWATVTKSRLAQHVAPVMRVMRSGLAQVADLGIDLPTHRGFDDGLDASLTQPTRQWTRLVEDLTAMGVSTSPELRAGDPRVLAEIEAAARRFHSDALDPYWPRLAQLAAGAVSRWALTLAQAGLEDLFKSLSDSISWHPPFLGLTVTPGRRCPPGCGHLAVAQTLAPLTSHDSFFAVAETGLTIIPTVFGQGCTAFGTVDPRQGPTIAGLAVPIDVSWETFAAHAPQQDHLSDLLGATRSWVLRVCAHEPITTSNLARAVGISVSSASEHASILRRNGLTRAVRDGTRVVHSATPLGVGLCNSTLSQLSPG